MCDHQLGGVVIALVPLPPPERCTATSKTTCADASGGPAGDGRKAKAAAMPKTTAMARITRGKPINERLPRPTICFWRRGKAINTAPTAVNKTNTAKSMLPNPEMPGTNELIKSVRFISQSIYSNNFHLLDLVFSSLKKQPLDRSSAKPVFTLKRSFYR